MLEGVYGQDRLFWWDEHWAGYDPLTIPEATDRAIWYGLGEYPYVRVDGSRVHIGIADCESTYQSLRALVEARLAETGGMSPVEITGRFLPAPSELRIDATFRLLDPAQLPDLRAIVVVIEDSVSVGDEIFPRVARGIVAQEIVLSQPGDVAVVHASVIPGQDWVVENARALVFLQQYTGNKQIIQGALLPGSVAVVDTDGSETVGLQSVIESITPNPFHESAEIRFHLTPAAAKGVVGFEILDPTGRRVLGPVVAPAGPGANIWRWNGRDQVGRRVQAGVYFARLRTEDGVSLGKLIRIQ
jgi:hypothetical protein